MVSIGRVENSKGATENPFSDSQDSMANLMERKYLLAYGSRIIILEKRGIGISAVTFLK
jgi:hypothetical protein